MYEDNAVDLDGTQELPDNTSSPLITVGDVLQQIDLIDKAPGSLKNIKAGFNKMVQLGLIDSDRIQEQFSKEGFPSLLIEVKTWVSQNNKNKQWPSFLNDIRQAVSDFSFSISDESPLSDTIRFFAYKKLGSHLSDSNLASEVAKEFPSSKVRDREYARNCYKVWLRDGVTRGIGSELDYFTHLDNFLNANGVILKKGVFLISIYRSRGQSGKASIKTIDLHENVYAQLQAFKDWKSSSVRPPETKQFKALSKNIDKKILVRAENKNPWTPNSDGIFSAYRFWLGILKTAYTFHKEKKYAWTFSFQSLFDEEFLEDFISWCIKRGVLGYCEKILKIVISEAKPKTFTSHYMIPHDYDSYEEWHKHLAYVSEIAKEQLHYIKKNRTVLDGKRNVKFIIESEKPWDVYFELLGVMKKIVAVKGNSLWTQASYLAFKWMIYAPLRVANVAKLKWLGDLSEREIMRLENSEEIGIFRFSDSGEFGIYVHKSHLKNKESDKIVSIFQEFTGIKADFERYLNIRKHELQRLGVESAYWAFGLSNSAKEGPGGSVSPTHVGNEIVKISQQALSIMYPDEYNPGVNPHAMRHLAATLYLNDNPENYVGLSTLLMDNLDTVMKVYAEINNKKNARGINTWASGRMKDAL